MNTIPDRTVILAVKSTVVAFDRQTGARLWTQNLGSSLSGNFVTVIADTSKVYAHTHGEVFCMDLSTGSILWRDRLSGLGYGIASIALPGSFASATPSIAARIKHDQSQNSGASLGAD